MSAAPADRCITGRKSAKKKSTRYRKHLEELVRKRTSELEESRKMIEEAQSLARMGSWKWDVIKDEISGSKEFYRLFDVTPEKIARFSQFVEKLHPGDRERVRMDVADALKHDRPYDTDYRVEMDDGTWRAINARGRVLDDPHGNPARMVGTCMDITERKRTENDLRETERRLKALNANLLRSNQELEQFAYVASHDLQEPLRMVSSFTQLLACRYEDKLDQDGKDFIGFAVDGANRMQHLIQDLLAYSRITNRSQPSTPLDTHDALVEAVSNLRIAIKEEGALVTNGELPRILGDHSQIVQVFQNLIGNGIKFHKPGESPRVHISAERNEEQPDFWTIKVADNGIGIEPRYFERLFVVFQRLHGKQEYPGTGIGLATCKRIIERHGGKIRIESEPRKGTTFLFTLPSEVRTKGTDT